jgi:phosphoserine phosphatase
MEYKNYSPDVWEQIDRALDFVLQQESQPIAAFDADGTLWDIDLGETYFHYLIDHKLVPLPPEPWEHYQTMKADPAGPQKAYLWLAQILKDVPLSTALEWSKKAVHEINLPYFPEQKKLIEHLVSKGVSIYIVTASVKWAVDPGAELLGLSAASVIGVETEVKDGIITDIQKGQITYRSGKAEALKKATGGKAPFLSSGNTMGDWHLLEAASHIRLAVSASTPDDKLFRTEQELQRNAQNKGWISHRFV